MQFKYKEKLQKFKNVGYLLTLGVCVLLIFLMLFLNYTSARATETEKCNAYKVKQPGCKMTANYVYY